MSSSGSNQLVADRLPASMATAHSPAAPLIALFLYGCLAYATPRFASPFGDQALLAPAAGFALAIAGLWGWRMVPLLLVVTWAACGFDRTAASLLTVATAGAQAAVGVAWLNEAAQGRRVRLESWREIVRDLVKPAAVAALAAAAIGSAHAAWQQGAAAAAFVGALRMMGDGTGVIVGAPVLLALFAEPRSEWSARRISLVLPLAILASTLIGASSAIARRDLARMEEAFGARANAAFEGIAERMHRIVDATDAVQGALQLMDGQVTRGQFAALGQPWLEKDNGIHSIGLHVRVARADIDAYVRRTSAEGEAAYRIFDRPGGVAQQLLATDAHVVALRHALVPQAAADEALRVRALGVNVLSIPEVRPTVLAALADGRARVTPAFVLTALDRQGPGVVMYRPVSRSDGQVVGVVYASVFLAPLLEPLAPDPSSGFALCVADASDPGTVQPLAGPRTCMQAREQPDLSRDHTLAFGERSWRVSARQLRSDAMLADGQWSTWTFGGPGLLATSSLALILLVATGQVERKRRALEIEAAGSAEALRSIFETATVGLVQLAPEGTIRQANPAFCALTGYDLASLRRMNIADLSVGRADDPGQSTDGEVSDATVAATGARRDYRRADGSMVPVSVATRVVRDAEGHAMFTVGAVQDLRETLRLREAERVRDQAEAASRAKSRFVASMSHELRTPLNAILGFAQLLGRRGPKVEESKAQEWLRRLQEAGWHLLAMIDDVLDLSRIEAAEQPPELCAVCVADLVDASVAMVADAAARQGIEVSVEVDEAVPAAQGDPVRVRQVLINLLSNAIKYNRPGGKVRIHVSAPQPQSVEVDVADTGAGMTSEQVAGLFRPFDRLGREQSAVQGTGIGLVIAKRQVELMQGSLRVRSEPGIGSVFTLSLLAAQREAPPVPSRAPSESRPPAAGRVLYVEDNETNVEIVRAMLWQRPQVDLIVAATGQDGLASISASRPRLVLLDSQLPDLAGVELLRRVRSALSREELPIVVVSADALSESVAAAMEAGANDYLTKPLDLQSLLSAIDRWVGPMTLATGRSPSSPDPRGPD